MKDLNEVLLSATQQCNNEHEEEGGIVLSHKEEGFEFIKLRNQNSGTPIAPSLWTADQYEYAEKILPKFAKGWQHYASFHTHPMFIPFPSHIDLGTLFPGFPINYIYSQIEECMTRWDYREKKESFVLGAMFDVKDNKITIHRPTLK